MTDKRYLVYMLKAKDGRVYIVMTGQTIEQRCRSTAYNGCPALEQAIAERGWKYFERSILREGLTKTEAEIIEKEFIALYDSTNHEKGFNVALGGNIQGRHSAETLHRMSESQKGRVFTDEHLLKLRKPKKGGSLRRIVRQYTVDGNFLRDFVSVAEAAKEVGSHTESIIRCCNGKQHTSMGYRWEYAEVFR